MKRLLLALSLVAFGVLLGRLSTGLDRRERTRSPNFTVDRSDPSDPFGRSRVDYDCYRVTSTDRGIVWGTPEPPPSPDYVVVTLTTPSGERTAYYGVKPR